MSEDKPLAVSKNPDDDAQKDGRIYEYALRVDPNQDDRACEINLCSFARPHMRAFHCSWWSFFIAFFIWFAIAPMLNDVGESLQIDRTQIWTSNICSVAGTIFMRFINGPLCDKFGARILMGIILMCASIPTALTGLVQSATGLYIIRFFIGLGGSTFVMCQFWATRMFTKEVAGTANALVGGWGNLGGGVTQIVMGSALFPLFKAFGLTADQAWRSVCVIPAVVAFVTGVTIMKISDDCPKGNYSDLKKKGLMPEISAGSSFRQGACNLNTWLLFIQYGCCFGVELTMNNAASKYFQDVFLLETESASAIASIFGWMNLFARGLGGFASDKCNSKAGMRGRLWWQSICLVIEGACVLWFSVTTNLGLAIFILVIFSSFVQAAEGSTYGIVPYVDPPSTGSIAGIIGAGGNTGAVVFGLFFRQLTDKVAFQIMGISILVSATLSVFVCIRGHRSVFGGEDSPAIEAAWKGTGTGGGVIIPPDDKDEDEA
mmetsp:Transcript_849/g.1022  ORF Transcript_849/g.1022 Transcript_849/m.1022 type:complete len:489 (-) Transcript_849:1028-2494(-)